MRHLSTLLVLTATITIYACGAEEEFLWELESAESSLIVSPDQKTAPALPELEGLTGKDLRAALYNLVQGHKSLGYNKAKGAIFVPQKGGLDVHDKQVECVYTGRKVPANGTTSPGGFNVEHSWPQSLGASSEPAKSDLNHLFAACAAANSRRGNMPFGETACAQNNNCHWQEGGSMIGSSVNSGSKVFQVRPEKQGDIARGQFYFAIRYKKIIVPEVERVLRKWNAADPVDQTERDRDQAISGMQSKGNPFIARPDLADLVEWGRF